MFFIVNSFDNFFWFFKNLHLQFPVIFAIFASRTLWFKYVFPDILLCLNRCYEDISEAQAELCHTSKKELFAKIFKK